MILDQQSISMLISMLEGNEQSGNVLNDYLEEQGQPRVVAEDFDELGTVDRMSFVLDEILPRWVATSIACDFSEHAIASAKMSEQELAASLKLLKDSRKFFTNDKFDLNADKDLVEQANAFLMSSWSPDTAPTSRAAWSAWATVMGKPSNVAVSAQAVDDGELAWQLDHLCKQLAKHVKPS